MLAMLWNWNHKFLGMKLIGVYLAVRILFRTNCVVGWPSSSRASSGNGMLKKTRRPAPACSAEASDSSGTDSRSVPFDSRLVESSVERFLCERRLRMDCRFVPPCEPVTLWVAQRNRFAGAVSRGPEEASLSSWYGWMAMVRYG